MDGMVILEKEGRKVFMMLALWWCYLKTMLPRLRRKRICFLFYSKPFFNFSFTAVLYLYSIDFRERI